MTCLKLRSPLLNIFYTLPQVDTFICDILWGCAHPDVRLSMNNQLIQLCRDIETGGATREVGLHGEGGGAAWERVGGHLVGYAHPDVRLPALQGYRNRWGWWEELQGERGGAT